MNQLLYMTFSLAMLGTLINRTHFLTTLLCIEGMVVTLFTMMTTTLSNTNMTSTASMPIMLITLGACEASTGLALLVTTANTHTNDYMKNFKLLKC
uniref:NADH-ubiquinone oxidoreductase chain 4L n=1 Tax=Chamaeleo zeylanicus TaxID=420384 RepID=B7S6B0_CHAZE|nr:NADH dehydrogenase subunit 4L [Chamaeleo zeylanicus]ABM89690.1 NADH dehydrogenase subunit 4L [Chamaeleo zeylanicus]